MNIQSLIQDTFGVKVYGYQKSVTASRKAARVYVGTPEWCEEDGIRTVNFAKTICSEVARLVMLGTKIEFSGARGEYMQTTLDKQYYRLREWQEYADAYGTIVIKPNGEDYECIMPWEFYITEVKDGDVRAAVFMEQQKVDDDWYTRLEYHRLEKVKAEDGSETQLYRISNRCFTGKSKTSFEHEVDIRNTPWSTLQPDVDVQNVEQPLFAVLRTPQANGIDTDCPLGLPIFADAEEELRDLDVAYSRMNEEIHDSRKIVLMDADRLMVDGGKIDKPATRIGKLNTARENMGLPHFIKAINEDNEGKPIYNEIAPTLNTEERLKGINHLLSQIGYKIGFANGYFVFNEASGIQTATGVEANEQRTIQFIKDCRDRMEKALRELIYAISAFASLYDLAPAGEFDVTFQFGDITYNEDEDRKRWWGYVTTGKVPFWYYLVKFEGFTDEEAKKLEKSARLDTSPYPFTEE